MKNQRYGYFYALSFVSLLVLAWASADLIKMALEAIFPKYPYLDSSPISDYRSYPSLVTARGFSLRFAALLVAFPVFLVHWLKTSGDVFRSKLEEFTESELSRRRGYCQIVLIFFSIHIFGYLTWIFSTILNDLLTSSEIKLANLTTPIPYFLVSLVLWVYHWRVLRDCDRRLANLLPIKAGEAKEESGYCGYCGAKSKKEFLYCPSCGKKQR